MHELTIIGLVVILIGTALTFIGQQRLNDRSSQLLKVKSDTIESLTKEISKINQEIAATVTGGDSFCYLFPSVSRVDDNTIDWQINHLGDYPVYDVFIRIWDDNCLDFDWGSLYEKYYGYRTKVLTKEEAEEYKNDPQIIEKQKALERESIEIMKSCLIFQENMGTIINDIRNNIMDPPIFKHTISKGSDLSNYNQEYSVQIIARNGHYKQKIKIGIYENKFWHVYSKVEKVINEKETKVVREYESVDGEGFVIKLII